MPVKLADNLTVRTALLVDAPAVTSLLNRCAIADYGVGDTTETDVLGWWQAPGFSLQQDTRLVFSAEGHLVGYMEFKNDLEHHHNFEVDVYVEPDLPDLGIGNYLFQAAEERARQEMALADPAVEVELKTAIWNVDHASRRVLLEEGYKLIRHFYRMVIEMDEPPPPPQWPKGLTVRTLRPDQEERRRAWEARNESFMDMWDFTPITFETFEYRMITSIPGWDPTLWFVAEDAGQVAGVNLCYPTSPEDPQMGFVRSLAVRRPWRKQGLGMALLLHSFGEFYRRGTRKVGLGVDASSLTGATRLYTRAGMRVERQADFFQKILRPGRESAL